jgi:hypothetical protein
MGHATDQGYRARWLSIFKQQVRGVIQVDSKVPTRQIGVIVHRAVLMAVLQEVSQVVLIDRFNKGGHQANP